MRVFLSAICRAVVLLALPTLAVAQAALPNSLSSSYVSARKKRG